MTNRMPTIRAVIIALTGFGTIGCESPTTSASFAVSATMITGMRGAGAIGSGQPTFAGVDRQVFDLDAGISGGAVYGRLDYVDYGFLKEDGNYPHFVVGPAWPGTAVLSFVQTGATCAEFEGVGFLINTGERLAFRIETCDNGQPGVGLDIFGIHVPQRLVTHGDVYRAGPSTLSEGDLTLSGTAIPALGTP